MRRLSRLGTIILAVLVSIDQFIQTILVAPFALAGLAEIPDPDATISGLLGRHAALNRLWARIGAAIIDALFLTLTLGQERNHCERTAAREKALKSPQARY